MIGKTLAHYKTTSQLGRGGMGEVYRAKDERKTRDVHLVHLFSGNY
jgi:serine/threonine protein kinase